MNIHRFAFRLSSDRAFAPSTPLSELIVVAPQTHPAMKYGEVLLTLLALHQFSPPSAMHHDRSNCAKLALCSLVHPLVP